MTYSTRQFALVRFIGNLFFASSVLAIPVMASEPAWIVLPYLQNPSSDAMTICWVCDSEDAGEVRIMELPDKKWVSQATAKPEIDFSPLEKAQLANGTNLKNRFLHRVRINGLSPGTTYSYTVISASNSYSSQLRTAPSSNQPIRFIVYADSETEPESTGKAVDWPAAHQAEPRSYVVDQTEGYRQNLKIISERNPNFVSVAGDLVEKGGRQLDWDEFWKHNAGSFGNLASSIPILPAIGNHENYAGLEGGYTPAGARRSIAKYQAYFETPDNGQTNPAWQDRFYRLDYGPITLITIDSSDGSPHATAADTNYLLLGEHDGGDAPDFNPVSAQYRWLQQQLVEAEKRSQFVFVQFHHMPYSVGVHGLPVGEGTGLDNQSGQPMRVLSPLFEKHHVAAVFCGHDEIYEHSVVNGVHYFDVGIGGDGLRGPATGSDGSMKLASTNPFQLFLAHLNSRESWNGRRLVDGGKHYGHMEVDVSKDSDGWKAELTPVYVFPLMNERGAVEGFERRTYDDVTLIRR